MPRARDAAPLLLVAVLTGCMPGTLQRPVPLREVVVTAQDFAFRPAALDLQLGQPVRLTLRNGGSMAHDLQILNMPASVQGKSQQHQEHGRTGANGAVHVGTEAPGQQATIDFVPTQAGEFLMICTVPGHAELGMRGSVRVR